MQIDPAAMQKMSVEEMMSMLMQQSGSDNPMIDELFQSVSSRARGAETAAAGAAQQSTDAREQPLPSTSPMADVLSRTIGSVADSLTGSQNHRKEADAMIKKEQDELLMKHMDDLKRLDAVTSKAADRAEQLGNIEDEMKFRKELGKLSEQRQLGLTMLKHRMDKEIKAMEDRNAEKMANIKAQPLQATMEDVPFLKDAAVNGTMEMSEIPSKLRGPVLRLAHEAGELILPRKARNGLSAFDGARAVLAELMELNEGITRGSGVSAVIREGVKNKIAAYLQTKGKGERARLYSDFREGVLAAFSRALGDVGTLNEGDMQRARSLTPGLDESAAIAAGKFLQMAMYMEKREAQIIRTYAYKLPGQQLPVPGKASKDDEYKILLDGVK